MVREDDDDDREERPRKRPRDEEVDEDDDDRPRRRGSSDGGVGYVIPYKNAPALASYYLGIFGLLLCFIGLGPVSGVVTVILGFMGMSRASKNPEAHGRAHAIVGIICGLVQILFGCGFAGLLVWSFMPHRP